MTKKIFFGFLIFTFLCGCKRNIDYENRYSLIRTSDSINIKISSSSRNLSFNIQYFTSNDTDYIALITEKFTSIEVYNLKKNKFFKLIRTDSKGSNSFPGMMGFVVKNIDTIILISTYPRNIGIINGEGIIQKKIPWEKESVGKYIEPMIPLGPYRPVLIDKEVHISLLPTSSDPQGRLTNTIYAHSYLDLSIDIYTGKSQLSSIIYPSALINKDITGIHSCRTKGYNDCFVYSFNLLDGLYVSKDGSELINYPLESNYKLKIPENNNKYLGDMLTGIRYTLSKDEIQDILYDEFRECYYVFIRKRIENINRKMDFRTHFLYPNCFILILDKYLKFMGEVFLPDNKYSFKMAFITKDGLYISEDNINNPTYNEDFLRFRLFKLKNDIYED